MKQTLLSLLLAAVLLLPLAACGGPEAQPSAGDAPATTEPEAKAVTIQETQLLAQEGLTITATEYTQDPILGPGVTLLLENQSQKTLSVQCSALTVNGCMIPSLFVTSVNPGKQANEILYLDAAALEDAGIETVGELTMRFTVLDDSSYDTLFRTERLSLTTSAGAVPPPSAPQGTLLWEEGGVRLTALSLREDDLMGPGLVLYLENNSQQDVVIQADSLSVNHCMVTPFLSCEVFGGCTAVTTLSLLSEDLERNSITSVDTMEMVFKVLDPDSFQTISTTQPLTYETK